MGSFAWLVGGAAGAVAVFPLLFRRLALWEKTSRLSYGLNLLIGLLGFLASLPEDPPFHPGQLLGFGFLLSTFFGSPSIALYLNGRGFAALLLGLVPFGLILLLFPGDPFPSLFGAAFAFAMLPVLFQREGMTFSLPFVCLAVSTVLARRHFELMTQVSPHVFQSVPLALSVAGAISTALVGQLESYRRQPASVVASILLSWVLLLVSIPALRFWTGPFQLLTPIGLAGISAMLVVALEGSAVPSASLLVWAATLASVFTGLSLTGPGPQWTRGYGVSLLALAVSWFSATVRHRSPSLRSGSALLFSITLLYLFAQSYKGVRADLFFHYTLIGFLVGFGVPALLGVWLGSGGSPFRSLTALFVTSLAPLVMTAALGLKAGAGFLAGSLVRQFVAESTVNWNWTALPALSLLIFGNWVAPLADLSRKARLTVLLAAAVSFILPVTIVRLLERMAGRRAPRLGASGGGQGQD